MRLIPLLIEADIPEAEIGAQVHHFAPQGQETGDHAHGGLVGHRGEDHLGRGRDLFRGRVRHEGQVHDAGQGRENLGEGPARIFQGGQGRQLAARMPRQQAHQLQPGITGSPDDCDVDFGHGLDGIFGGGQGFRRPSPPPDPLPNPLRGLGEGV